MNDKKEEMTCDECGGKLIKDFIRSETYCSECGLVWDPIHPMGKGFSGLLSYMGSRGLNDHIESVRVTFTMQGLAAARLMVSKL